MNTAAAKKRRNPLSGKINFPLLASVFLLLIYGLVALYSASTVESLQRSGSTTYYIFRQFVQGGLLGIVVLVLCSKIDYHYWQKALPLMLVATLAMLALVKISSFGFSAGGAERWLHLGVFTFQPSELAKLTVIIYIAAWVDKKRQKINDFYFGLLPSLIIVLLFAGLILWQPDMGTMLVVLSLAAAMLFVAGIDWRYIFSGLTVGATALYLLIKFEPYRARRLTAFLNPDFDPQGISYHINQALLAIGSGGLWGYGYGLSRQKHNYLPEVMNDSIFAVTAEELGFLRAAAILALFAFFAYQGTKVAFGAPDMFGKMLATGITFWISIQAIINVAAMVNLLPLTGIPLPFFSYGSSALVITLAGVGILMNVSRQSA